MVSTACFYTRYTSLRLKIYRVHQRYPGITCTILWISRSQSYANLLFLVNKNECSSRNHTEAAKNIGQTNDIPKRPSRGSSQRRSTAHLPRTSRRTINILRTSASKLLHNQRKAVQDASREERQELNLSSKKNKQGRAVHSPYPAENVEGLPFSRNPCD